MSTMVKKVLLSADTYIKNADWKDLSLLKICLFSCGLAVGCGISGGKKKWIAAAMAVFIVTCIPLAAKYLPCLAEQFAGREADGGLD